MPCISNSVCSVHDAGESEHLKDEPFESNLEETFVIRDHDGEDGGLRATGWSGVETCPVLKGNQAWVSHNNSLVDLWLCPLLFCNLIQFKLLPFYDTRRS